MSRQKDILDELNKDELLAWVRTQFFRAPKRSEILYLRWLRQSKELQLAYEVEGKSMDGVDLAKRDRLADLFNASNNPAEKLRLLEQIKPYDEAMLAHIKRYQTLDARQKKLDRLSEQIDIEFEKETAQ